MRFTGLAFWDAVHGSSRDPRRGEGHGTKMVGTLWELHPAWKAEVVTAR
jgi:hypothetical protein